MPPARFNGVLASLPWSTAPWPPHLGHRAGSSRAKWLTGGRRRTARDAQQQTAANPYVCQTEREIGKERSRRGGQDITTLLLFQVFAGRAIPARPLLPSLCQVCSQLRQPTISTLGQPRGGQLGQFGNETAKFLPDNAFRSEICGRILFCARLRKGVPRVGAAGMSSASTS